VIELNKESFKEELSDSLADTKLHLDDFYIKVEERLKQTVDDSHNKVSKVKDICATYFEKYDTVNLCNEKKFEKVNSTFIEWKDTVMKPLNNSEARLYAVETRLKETENKLFKNFAHSRDVLKKLVFALEQENISTKDSLMIQMMQRAEPNFEGIQFDTLKTQNSNAKKISKDKSMDFLFIKRLLFIKHDIDEYPKEVDDVFKPIESVKARKPKSLLGSKANTRSNSMYADYKPRVRTTASKFRKREFSSINHLNLFDGKRSIQKDKTNNVNLKNSLYSHSIISGTEKSVLAKSKAQMKFLKQRVAWGNKPLHNKSDKLLPTNYSKDDLCEDSQFLTQQQRIADQTD